MKKLISLVAMFSLISACHAGELVLQKKDALGFKFLVIEENNIVQLSGLCGHSAYVIKRESISVEKHGAVLVEVFVGSSKKEDKASSNFKVDVPLTPTLKTISFGKPETVVWTRP